MEDDDFFTVEIDHETEELTATAMDVLRRLHDRSPSFFDSVIRRQIPIWLKVRSLPVWYESHLNGETSKSGEGFPMCPHCAASLEKFIYVEESTRRDYYSRDDLDRNVWILRFSDRVRIQDTIHVCDECELPFQLPEQVIKSLPPFYN